MKRMMRTIGFAAGLLVCGAVMAQEQAAATNGLQKTAEKGATNAAAKAGLKLGSKAKSATPGREAVITAERIEFDNKEGVILFDQKVLVDDEQFVMRADQLLVFMEGTNDVQQIMAVGSVSITNDNRCASCDKAVYTKKSGQIVMTGHAKLMRQGSQGGEVTGERITFWLDDERMEVYPNGRVVLPPGTFNKSDSKLIPKNVS